MAGKSKKAETPAAVVTPEVAPEVTPQAPKYEKGAWRKPHVRANGYNKERRAKVHMWGTKRGHELTDMETGVRLGYLQCQNDHAGMYKYMKAVRELGMTKEQAQVYSRTNQKKNNKGA